MKNIVEIAKTLNKLKTDTEVYNFLLELFTDAELIDLSKRWRILNMLNNGCSQREIAKELQVSLCKITRGAKILKNKNSVVLKYLRKDNNNDKYSN